MRLHNPRPAWQAEYWRLGKCTERSQDRRWWPAGSHPPPEGARWWPAGAPEPASREGTNKGDVTKTINTEDIGDTDKSSAHE